MHKHTKVQSSGYGCPVKKNTTPYKSDSDWEDAVKEIMTDANEHSKIIFKETMQVLMKETLPSDTQS